MAAELKNEVVESVTTTDTEVKKTQRKKGVLSRIWNALFSGHRDDFEKRLQHISKEEASVLKRVTRRSHSWRRMSRNLVIFSVLLEILAVAYAIMTTRSLDFNWKMRALRVLPMFLLPALSFITYSSLGNFRRMLDRKDHKILEKLRAERQEKIDELKERTNYYITQQLIQRYDPDPAAKAAAATVLASKLGADSGLKVFVGDESKVSAPTGKSNDVEVARTSGLRYRNPSHAKSSSMENASMQPGEVMVGSEGGNDTEMSQQQLVVEHHDPHIGSSSHDGGWVAKLAALLVGEDPTQSYALICGNCHMHNGLARREDFPYITYYCPHCHALNRPKHHDERVSGSNTPSMTSLTTVEDAGIVPSASSSPGGSSSLSNTPVLAAAEINES